MDTKLECAAQAVRGTGSPLSDYARWLSAARHGSCSAALEGRKCSEQGLVTLAGLLACPGPARIVAVSIKLPSYSGYRFPSDIVQRAVWMYLRFTLSFRDVEELLAERGLQVSYESIRCWVLTFDPMIARRLRALNEGPIIEQDV